MTPFYREAIRIAREASPQAIQELVSLALTAEDERVKSVCLVASRPGRHSPRDYDPAQDQPKPTWDPGAFTPEEREQFKLLLQKAIAKG
jgi:hypothetical protein